MHSFAGYFAFDQENAVIVSNGQIIKGFYWLFLYSHIFEGQEKVSFILGSILMLLFPCIGDSISEKNISWLAWGSSRRI